MFEKIVNGFKAFWFPIIVLICSISFACYMMWKETKLNSYLVEEALKGNTTALKFLSKYDKPWKNEKIVRAAINGNKYALEALQINDTNR